MGVMDDTGPGIITATIQETFEPLHTGHSLIFTIAPNGHVWGKRLSNESDKNDLEIEIFAPVHGGYLFRRTRSKRTTLGEFETALCANPDITAEQKRKINLILSQKEKINYLLGTLMLRSHEVSLVGNYHHWDCDRRKNFERPSINPEGLPYSTVVRDCSYANADPSSRWTLWHLKYDDASFRFSFSPIIAMRWRKSEGTCTGGEYTNHFMGETHHPEFDKDFPRIKFFSVQAQNKKFDLRSWNHKTLPPELKIMFGEYDFFDFFEVDDAVLLLEERQTSETESEFYWTLGVAQNKLIRNLMRLKSNNPELLTKQ